MSRPPWPSLGAGMVALALSSRVDGALRIVDVDASPAIDELVPALRVTLVDGVSPGVTRCPAPAIGRICPLASPATPGVEVRLARPGRGVRLDSDRAFGGDRLPTAWVVVLDAGAPIAPRWADARSAAFSWLDEVPSEGDRVAVVVLGETHHVSRSPWFSYAERGRASDALGFYALPLMPLGRDEALGPVVRAAVAELVRELPMLPTAGDVGRVVVGLFSDGRTATAQEAYAAKRRAHEAPPPARRSRLIEYEAFWFPHDSGDARADGSGGMLDVAAARGRVHRVEGTTREAVVRGRAREAKRLSERPLAVLLDAAELSLFPEVPSVALVDADGMPVDVVEAGRLPLGREAWPLPKTELDLGAMPVVRVPIPLGDVPEGHRAWRAFWLARDESQVAVRQGMPVDRGVVEALVATDHELEVRVEGPSLFATLPPAALVARAQGALSLVVYDATSGRATPIRHDRALVIARGNWAAPLVDGPRVLRFTLLAGSLGALLLLAHLRRRADAA